MSENAKSVNRKTHIVTIVLIVVLLLALIVMAIELRADKNSTAEEVAALSAEVEELTSEAAQDAQKLAEAEVVADEIQAALDETEAENDALQAEIEDLQSQITESAELLGEAEQKIENLQTELDTAKANAEAELQALDDEYDAYKETAELVLSQYKEEYEADMTLAAEQLEAEKTEIEVIEVSDIASLLEAIGSNRTIRLLPGDYDLSSDEAEAWLELNGSTQSEYVHYGTVNDIFNGVVITNVQNMTIVAEDPQEIYTKITTDTVLLFDQCSDITVSGITFGHKPETGSGCNAGVILLMACDDITFHECDLYGCGYEGARFKDSTSVVFEDCIIRDCSNSAIYMEYCEDVEFMSTEIYGTGTEDHYAVRLVWIDEGNENIVFRECYIHDNGNMNSDVSSSAIFEVSSEYALTIMDCRIENNGYALFIKTLSESITTVSADYEAGATYEEETEVETDSEN